MKGRIATVMAALVTIAFLVGCAGMPKVKVPAIKEKEGPLAKILVYVGEVPLGESGRSADGTEINIGGIVVFTAQGRDAKGNPIAVNPTWTPSKPGIVEITPAVGSKVSVRGLKEGRTDIVVEYAGVKRTVEFISVE
jgi:hypothetical protein